ncbi:Voltage-gated hydrogen channel [Lachnellula occidentalis]|uniref:Voltage-gated hydrogen channel 1 n=1 Tax=Lachnellula occidentalis TaxID=215460 RepID=A0A8H8RHB8_9HELO|nr:Voltage-gated hydrogen channel [Lachnellula occidentalis]
MPYEASSSSTQPLLSSNHGQDQDHDFLPSPTNSSNSSTFSSQTHPRLTLRRFKTAYTTSRNTLKTFLSTRAQHYTVLALVSCDLLGIFADIIINLYQCDAGATNAKWDEVRDGLGIAGLVFSCLFLAELGASIWAFGLRYFNSWFHCFDAAVIIAGFIVDVLLHGILEEVASLVVVLRLWRFFKIIEEFSVGAEEQMDGLELRIDQLESENLNLRRELKRVMGQKGTLDEEENAGFRGEC